MSSSTAAPPKPYAIPVPVQNGSAEADSSSSVDPAVLLLVGEFRRGQDAVRGEMVAAQRDTTAAISALADELKGLRAQAPRRLSFHLASGLLLLAVLSVLGLLSSRGVDVAEVAKAAHELIPAPSSAVAGEPEPEPVPE